ncbi:MAG: MBL fold metallo-hydrolase [Gemmatimonadales bacterium]
MKLAILGSGSRGNALAIAEAGETLLVDAGFGIRAISRRSASAGVALDSLSGIVITHEHGDHARGAPGLARRSGCPVFATPGTLEMLSSQLEGVDCHRLTAAEPRSIGPFTVSVCRTNHDAAEPIAVTVELCSGTKLGMACDVGSPTRALRRLLHQCHCLVIEANHDDLLLRTSAYPASVRRRIAGSRGHLSNRAAADLLGELCHERLETVVLVHLSAQSNTPELARQAVAPVLESRGFMGQLVIACQDEAIPTFSVASSTSETPTPVLGTGSSSSRNAT